MLDVDLVRRADGAGSGGVDRRTLLLGAAGGLAVAGLSGPTRAAGHAASVAARSGPPFDPQLVRQLERALRDALRDPSITAPGAILHIRSPKLGAWTGVAGLGRVAPDEPMRRRDRFRAGSIAKPFVSVVVLQLAERGRLSLDARLPDVLPESVVGRFANAADITVRMLLGNRSGIPRWLSPAVAEQVARDPAKVWKVSEFLDLAAAQPPVFAPGAGFLYSDRNYNLRGLMIEQITGRSWRHVVTRRVIRPLRLTHRLGPPRPRGGRSRRARDAVPHEAPARTGIGTGATSSSSVSGVSPGGAHQHEAQAHAVTNGAWSATTRGSVRGLRLIANAAMAPTATSAAPIITAGFMPSTNCWPEP
jgi:CubicO group peptidase (beta-lactamase class C family)